VCDGEQSRQHFVHGFLEQVEGIDFEHKVKMGIRNNRYDAMVPQVVAAAAAEGPCPRHRSAAGACPHRRRS
jgi:5-methyltetrahydropteroyltriglutamate--homocysteine methyltransferase